MNGTAACPTCGAPVAVGTRFCSGCGQGIEWAAPGAAAPPPYAPSPQGPLHHGRRHAARRGGSSSGLWVLASVVVLLIGGGIVLWQLKQRSEPPRTPVVAPIGNVAPGGATLSPFLLRFSEAYPRFYQDLAYAAEPVPLVPPARSFAHRRSIAPERDAYRDCTFLVLRPSPLDVQGTGSRASASHTTSAFSGWRRAELGGVPQLVTLVFQVTGPRVWYPDHASLVLTADAKTIALPNAAWSERGEEAGSSLQTLAFPVKTALLVEVLAATKVAGRLADTPFEWGEEDLEALRDFASRLSPGR